MKKRLLGLVYLLAKTDKQTVTTANIGKIVNKIPCDEDAFFKMSMAQSYVLKQMCQYPATQEQKEEYYAAENSKPEKEDDAEKIADLLVNLPCDLNYLEVEQARDWLKQLDREQLQKNKENLKLLQSHLQQTLDDGQYESYVQESVALLIQELGRVQFISTSDLL